MRRERMTNPKCLGGSFPDTFNAKSADSTGLKMNRITRAVSFDRPGPPPLRRRYYGSPVVKGVPKSTALRFNGSLPFLGRRLGWMRYQ
jgi:hypothetical protein